MKKWISIMICLMLVVGIVGCGGNSAKPADSGKETDKTNETNQEADKDADKGTDQGSAGTEDAGGKLVIWAWDQNLPSINFAVDKYKQNNPDSKVEVDVQNVPETVDKISTFLASGIGTDLPDVVLMDNLQIQAFIQQFPEEFVNLSEMGYDQHKDSFSKAHWELLSHQGSLYAFPFDIAPVMLVVNTEILDKSGVNADSFKTWDDVIAAAPAIINAGYSVAVKFDDSQLRMMLQSAGVGIFDADRNIDLLNPKVIEVVQLYKQLVEAKVSDPIKDSGTSFGAGEIAIRLKPAWMVGEDMPVETDLTEKVKLVDIPMVKNADGYTASANDGGSSFFILNTSKNKQAAYDICQIITTDMESQDIALGQGLMPGYLPAAELESFQKPVDYFQGQKIWKLLSDSSINTPAIYINEFYSSGKEVLKNMVSDPIVNGTDKSVEDLLKEAADLLASQTGLSIKEY